MNTEIKAILGVVFSLYKVGKDLVEKKSLTEMLPDIEHLGVSIIPVVSNLSSFTTEIKALPGSAEEADLVEFVVAQFALVNNDPKAQAILAKALIMASNLAIVAENGVDLAQAIKG